MLPRAEDFVGQGRTLRLLDAYLRKERVGGTFLLLGEKGLGKTTLATVLARAITCERNREQPRLHFCGECYACRSIAAGDQPEYVIVRPEGKEISIVMVREKYGDFRAALLHPAHLSHRIFVIDDAHALNEETGNRLLKVMEEGPGHTIFILVSDKPALMLPTILSRSHQLRLSALPIGELAAVLRERVPEAGADGAAEAARMAAGRYVDGLQLARDPAWRGSIAQLAEALHTAQGTVAQANKAAEYEFAPLWEKELDNLGLSEAEAAKQIAASRKNELKRQALLSAYDRASWWLLERHQPTAELAHSLSKLKQRINQRVDSTLAQVAFENAIG